MLWASDGGTMTARARWIRFLTALGCVLGLGTWLVLSPRAQVDPLVGTWQFFGLGVFPSDERLVLSKDGHFVHTGSTWRHRADPRAFRGQAARESGRSGQPEPPVSSDGESVPWRKWGTWRREGDLVILMSEVLPAFGDESTLRLREGFLNHEKPADVGPGSGGRFLLHGRDWPEPRLRGDTMTEAELAGDYVFDRPSEPHHIALAAGGRFTAVARSGAAAESTPFEGTWTIRGDRLCLDMAAEPPWHGGLPALHEEYVTFRDGRLVLTDDLWTNVARPCYTKLR